MTLDRDDLQNLEVQKRLIRELAPAGVPRGVLRALFSLNQNEMSSRASSVGISFREHQPVSIHVTRTLLAAAGIPEHFVENSLGYYSATTAPRSGAEPKKPKPVGESKVPAEKAKHRATTVRGTKHKVLTPEERDEIIAAPTPRIEMPTSDEVTRFWMKQLFAPQVEAKVQAPPPQPAPKPVPKQRAEPTDDPSICKWPVPGNALRKNFVCGAPAQDGWCKEHGPKVQRYRPLYVTV